MSKRYTSKRDLALIFLRQDGRCKRCPKKLIKGNHHIDHVIPVSPVTGGTDTVDNKQALCIECHVKKTRGTGATTAGTDIGNITKLRRHLNGGRARRGRPMDGSRDSKFKVCMSSGGKRIERR